MGRLNKILLKPFMYLAGLGVILSFMVHVSSLLSLPIPISAYRMLIIFLIIFSFIAAIAAVMVLQDLCKDVKSKNFWKAALRGSPTWQKYLLFIFFGYVVLIFIIFRVMSGDEGRAGVNGLSLSNVKEISAFVMAFYFFSMATLYSGIHVQTDIQARRCPNGHPVSPTTKFCGECGLEVINP